MDKRSLSTELTRSVVNPVIRRLAARGLAPGVSLLETTGRRSGEPRVTPVGASVEGSTVWIVAEHGRRAGYVRNIEADPRVRVRTRAGWRTGTAVVLADDDPRARQRAMGNAVNALMVRTMGTDLLTVRIDLDP
jgi:deazaflavin-dependent oxidoreductase (nitroreductase family)